MPGFDPLRCLSVLKSCWARTILVKYEEDYIYIYIYRVREREKGTEKERKKIGYKLHESKVQKINK